MDLDSSVHPSGLFEKPSLHPRRILIAEDDEGARDLVAGAFVEDGHQVIELVDAAELVDCLDLIARSSLREPDLVALGVPTARASELELLEGIRIAGWTMPVVLMTWLMPRAARSRIEKDRSVAVICKPFNRTELRVAVARAFASAKSSEAVR